MVAAVEPGSLDVLRPQLHRGAAVGGHRASAVGRDERADEPVSAPHRPDDVDPSFPKPCPRHRAGLVVTRSSDEPGGRAERSRPRGEIRRLAAGRQHDLRLGIALDRDRPAQSHDDVEGEVSERAHQQDEH